MPSLRVLLLVAMLFLLVLLLRLPASWVVAALPGPVVCDAPAGTAWNGSCGALRFGARSVANLHWQVLPEELLHAKLGVRAQVSDVAIQGSGKALVSLQGHVQGYDLVAKLPIPNPLATGTPPGWTGLLELDLPRFEARGQSLQSLRGVARLRELQQAQPRTDFGGIEWQLPEGALREGRLNGTLRDLGGPLTLQGTLTLGLNGDYDLNAKLAAGPGAGESLQQSLQQLGPADAQGFHSLLAAGTL